MNNGAELPIYESMSLTAVAKALGQKMPTLILFHARPDGDAPRGHPAGDRMGAHRHC